MCCVVLSQYVASDSLWPNGLQPARILCPWDFPVKNTGVGFQALFQWILQPKDWTHVSWASGIGEQILVPLSHLESPPKCNAAKSLQSCPTLCDPVDGSPPGSAVAGILQATTLEWVAISFSTAWKWKVKVKLLSHVWLFATPWTEAYQAPPSMGFSRQEYWSGVPLPSTDKKETRKLESLIGQFS